MKRKIFRVILSGILACTLASCEKEVITCEACPTPPHHTDCRVCPESDIKTDLMVDPRDSTVYKIVRLRGQWWMAENLKFEMPGAYDYYNDPVIGNMFGKLYTWTNAREACPPGWRLPTQEEYVDLMKIFWVELWLGGCSGFDAIAGGDWVWGRHCMEIYRFKGFGFWGTYWSSSESHATHMYGLGVQKLSGVVGWSIINKEDAVSCRCVKGA